MFNTTIVRPTQYIPTHVEINDKRAPTDDSVRLLKELEEKAEAKILSVNRLETNKFSATYTIHEDLCRLERVLKIRFDLNGVEHKVSVDIERRANREAAAKQAVRAIVDEIARAITSDILIGEGLQRELLQ